MKATPSALGTAHRPRGALPLRSFSLASTVRPSVRPIHRYWLIQTASLVLRSRRRGLNDIDRMGKTSEAIFSLRPVTFHYKGDTTNTPQFGLIAEEVAKVNAALILVDNEGKPYSVRYEHINAMLLNEFLKEHRAFREEQSKVERLEKQVAALAAGLQKVSAQLATASPPLADLR